MKNKIFTLGLAFILATGALVGCTNSGNSNSTPSQNESTDSKEVESGLASEFHEAIKEAYGENYLPSMELDETSFAEKFNVTMDNVKEFIAEVPMIGAHVDTLVIIEANEGKVDEVESELNKYREALISDTMQYPMNLAKINSSQVYKLGNYVFFVMLGAIDEVNEDEKEQLEFAQAETQKAIDAINDVANK